MQVVPLKVGFRSPFQSPEFMLKWLPAASCLQLSTNQPVHRKTQNSVDIVLHNPVKTVLTAGW